jgi:hypothetical protein
MQDREFERLVIVVTPEGSKFLGMIPEQIYAETGDGWLFEALDEGRGLVSLENARQLIIHHEGVRSSANQMLGVSMFPALLPVDLADGPMNLSVRVSWGYHLSQQPNSREKIEALLSSAEKSEQLVKARKAGIHLPGHN